ncbi:Lactoylglutathione lyase [hydrothermal vent metagenome]|uniref:lactoylglutathione lyase n=1 Tax=hydrothermal vent metagenome TaxID=652676 RepID=A0A3B0ZMV9_9ZZZZ
MRRILHTMLRVGNMQRSVNFYTQIIGMKVLRTLEQQDEAYTLVFLGFEDESETSVLELTYNYGISTYDLGNAYGHIAIGVEDIHKVSADMKNCNIQFSLEPCKLMGSNEIIAFITDPDGYKIELIERPRYDSNTQTQVHT